MLGLMTVAATLLGSAPTEPDPRWLTLPNGLTLRYEERGDTTGDPLILLHGYTDSRQSFERLASQLPYRVRTIAIDLRGHGDSDRPGSYDLREMANDVVRFIEAKRLRRVTLVGHSMGSLVAREAARKARSRVAGLVLIGSGVTFDNEVVRGLQAELNSLGDAIDREFVEGFQRSTLYAPVPAGFLDKVIEASSTVPPAIWRDVLVQILEYNDSRSLASIRVPTMLMWGSRDAIVSRTDQEALLSGIPGSYLVEYRDVGHAPHWERPAAVVADLLAFLEGEPDRR
jgi:non-heme chloroperoxidase